MTLTNCFFSNFNTAKGLSDLTVIAEGWKLWQAPLFVTGVWPLSIFIPDCHTGLQLPFWTECSPCVQCSVSQILRLLLHSGVKNVRVLGFSTL